MELDRRRSPRYSFIARAEVSELQSGTLLDARTSDLSSEGCYVDTMNPLPKGAVVNVRITHGSRVFVARGVVSHLEANMGMGITFIALESGCEALLKTWLHELGGEPHYQKRRRSQRVMLHVEVLIRAESPGGECTQLPASTLVVNAHGGLLASSFELVSDQKFTLISTQSGKLVGCRVVRVDSTPDKKYTIAFEFDQPSPQFWPITFPPEDWQVHEENVHNYR